MKKIITLLAFTISFSVNAQVSTYQTTASGVYSTAIGINTTASGGASTAMGDNTTASGDYSTAMGVFTTASGDESTAMGYQTTASGYTSTAMGYGTTASGYDSTAMGRSTEASGYDSTAMGRSTEASGYASTAMGRETTASGSISTVLGYNTTASDYGSLVIGQYNLLGSTVTNNSTGFSTENTAFVIGNGADADNRTDALTVLFDGTTNVAGSVTATSFIGDGSQLTNLPSSSPFSLNTTSGNGIQSSTNIASGDFSTAIGSFTTASSVSSTAMGLQTEASGYTSTAMGLETEASGYTSTAMGRSTEASGYISTAMGYYTEASGDYSTAMGYYNEASGDYSIAIGSFTTASGNQSTAIGRESRASDFGSLVIGQYNLLGSTVTNNSTSFSLENTAFVIGNGGNHDDRSDALTVLFDGTTTIAGDLSINSDARLKANIISLGSTLAKVLQIDGKSYTMKKDENNKQKIGVLAQDIEKVFPELVSESNGVKSVNYQGLVPVLINALKEQDAKMNEQQTEIDELKEMVQALVSRE